MKLTWYGHACFRLESPDGTVVFDPYEPGSVPGLRLPELRADAAIYSHGHSDHYSPESVTLSGVKPAMKLRQMATWHDGKRGELRGSNIVSAVTTEGMTLVHLGDLGHELSEKQLEELGKVTVLLIPVGGYYTIDVAQAKRTADAVGPKIIVPMHYREGHRGIQNISGVDRFLEMFKPEQIHMLPSDRMEIDTGTPGGVYVFPWPKG